MAQGDDPALGSDSGGGAPEVPGGIFGAGAPEAPGGGEFDGEALAPMQTGQS